jgi:hypothetical protein
MMVQDWDGDHRGEANRSFKKILIDKNKAYVPNFMSHLYSDRQGDTSQLDS